MNKITVGDRVRLVSSRCGYCDTCQEARQNYYEVEEVPREGEIYIELPTEGYSLFDRWCVWEHEPINMENE